MLLFVCLFLTLTPSDRKHVLGVFKQEKGLKSPNKTWIILNNIPQPSEEVKYQVK